jgi:hypothetical protein
MLAGSSVLAPRYPQRWPPASASLRHCVASPQDRMALTQRPMANADKTDYVK